MPSFTNRASSPISDGNAPSQAVFFRWGERAIDPPKVRHGFFYRTRTRPDPRIFLVNVIARRPEFKASAARLDSLHKTDQIFSFIGILKGDQMGFGGFAHLFSLDPTHSLIRYFVAASTYQVKTSRTSGFSATCKRFHFNIKIRQFTSFTNMIWQFFSKMAKSQFSFAKSLWFHKFLTYLGTAVMAILWDLFLPWSLGTFYDQVRVELEVKKNPWILIPFWSYL